MSKSTNTLFDESVPLYDQLVEIERLMPRRTKRNKREVWNLTTREVARIQSILNKIDQRFLKLDTFVGKVLDDRRGY